MEATGATGNTAQTTGQGALNRLLPWLGEPINNAGVTAFRILFGLMNLYGTLRFISFGWVDRFYVQPSHYLTFWAFEWVTVLPPTIMHGVFWTLAALSACIAAGFLYRFAILLFFLLFTYVELIDVSNYLNHYWLVSLIAFVMCWLPLNRRWSVDAWLRPAQKSTCTPRLVSVALKFQIGVVYFFAGLAKLGSDWLLHAQPLNIWLSARTETPLIGPWLDHWWIALAMSWGGFLFDISIWAWLLWRPTRPWAYALVVFFHTLTGYFFLIGMFPIIMMTGATIFFADNWPERLWSRTSRFTGLLSGRGPASSISHHIGAAVRPELLSRTFRLGVFAWLCWALVMTAMPLRAHLYGGNVLWHEQGMRWSWRVMVREKNGAIDYRVVLPREGRQQYVSPSRYLTAQQEREMSGQPDLILQLAHHIAREYRAAGHDDVQVYVEALVSLNGRPPQPLIDPERDLTTVTPGPWPADWILPAPTTPPPHLSPIP
jgi:vitamin K-dependent gamma-carboxylase